MKSIRRLVPVSVFFFVVAAPAGAADEAQTWLLRIHEAPKTLNYEGTFVYQRGEHLDTMRIFHRAGADGAISERLISLTGPAREVIRTDQEVRCYLPDQKSVFIEQRRLDRKSFINIVPERLPELAENYAIELGRKARVAGRPAQQLTIRALDDFRYGYRLWADEDTGLLLRADLTDDKGKTLEQFMFTQLDMGRSIADAMLEPHTSSEGMAWYRDDEVTDGKAAGNWRATHIPKGFKLSSSVLRRLPKDNRVVRQLVYSDSLAAISVFIERLNGNDATDPVGQTRMGALNALRLILDGHHVTVVGEVPEKTIVMIGDSIAPVSEP